MSSKSPRVPLEIAHRIFVVFGITTRTRAYERWVKDDGFDQDDIGDVIRDSEFIFGIDWRAWLQEELEGIQNILALLKVELELELDEEGESGFVICGEKRAPVRYTAKPEDDSSMDTVIRAIQSVVPAECEFRKSPGNEGSDGWGFAVLLKEQWAELDSFAKSVMETYFVPLGDE